MLFLHICIKSLIYLLSQFFFLGYYELPKRDNNLSLSKMNFFIIYKQTFDFSPLPKPSKNLPHFVVYMRQMFFFVTFEHVFVMVRLQKCQLYHEQNYPHR